MWLKDKRKTSRESVTVSNTTVTRMCLFFNYATSTLTNVIDAVCEEINDLRTNAKNREAIEKWKVAREKHSTYIAGRRKLVLAAEHRARQNPDREAMIYIDGADQNTTYCPQHWRTQLRLEQAEKSYIAQRIMSVLIIGQPDQLRFYSILPGVSELLKISINTIFRILTLSLTQMGGGMNVSVSCLLDALQYIDSRAESLRVQIDGT